MTEFTKKPQITPEGESVTRFFQRHFNQEIIDYAVDPFVGGIYAGSPDSLSVSECFPKLVEIEQQHGSILKGLIKSKNKKREIISFKNGLQELVNALYKQVKEYTFLNQPIRSISSSNGKWVVKTNTESFDSDFLINCLPPTISASLFKSEFPNFAKECKNIDSPPITIIHTAFNKKDFTNSLNGFGCLIPSKEKQFISGCIWNSSVFDNRCPDDEILLTNIVTHQHKEALPMSTEDIQKNTIKDLQRIFKSPSLSPTYVHMFHYKKSIPQYNQAIKYTKNQLIHLERKKVFTATNWSKEISVVGSIKNSLEISKKIISLYDL